MKKTLFYFLFPILICSCQTSVDRSRYEDVRTEVPGKFLVVLGIVQDAGYPQLGCTKECCNAYWEGNESKKHITCLAVVDSKTNQYWFFEATPDITEQLHAVQSYLTKPNNYTPNGIFMTHAHIGHYTGLMQLGKEAVGAHKIPVYAMPRLDSFLRNNGPWSQLVQLRNIKINPLQENQVVPLGDTLQIIPIPVPHRDEYSETVGFRIESPRKKILFIPDIDKWGKWSQDLGAVLKTVDLAFLDGAFFSNGELPGRDMSAIPHPFVEETMQKLQALPEEIRHKIVFIHFNHTNPLLRDRSKQKNDVIEKGFQVAEEGMVIPL